MCGCVGVGVHRYHLGEFMRPRTPSTVSSSIAHLSEDLDTALFSFPGFRFLCADTTGHTGTASPLFPWAFSHAHADLCFRHFLSLVAEVGGHVEALRHNSRPPPAARRFPCYSAQRCVRKRWWVLEPAFGNQVSDPARAYASHPGIGECRPIDLSPPTPIRLQVKRREANGV